MDNSCIKSAILEKSQLQISESPLRSSIGSRVASEIKKFKKEDSKDDLLEKEKTASMLIHQHKLIENLRAEVSFLKEAKT